MIFVQSGAREHRGEDVGQESYIVLIKDVMDCPE
jgi:hypothetical protein